MGEKRESTTGLERLAFFTDAVAAIAMTLLIVPLVEVATAEDNTVDSAADFLYDNRWQLMAFVISFAVIAALWTAHHRIFEDIADYSPMLRNLNLMWVFTIAFLPLPTALASEYNTDRVTIAVYIGTMMASSLLLAALVIVIRRHPELRSTEGPPNDHRLAGAVTTSSLFLLAFIVGVTFPSVGFLALLLLFLAGVVEPIVYRRIATRSGERYERSPTRNSERIDQS